MARLTRLRRRKRPEEPSPPPGVEADESADESPAAAVPPEDPALAPVETDQLSAGPAGPEWPPTPPAVEADESADETDRSRGEASGAEGDAPTDFAAEDGSLDEAAEPEVAVLPPPDEGEPGPETPRRRSRVAGAVRGLRGAAARRRGRRSPSTLEGSPESPGTPEAPAGPEAPAVEESTESTAETAEAPDSPAEAPERPADPGKPSRPLWSFVLAAHPVQTLLTALGVATASAFLARPAREVAIVFGTVLVGGTILGWHNDLVDRERDARHERSRKPIAEGRLDPGTVWFALACAVLLLVPLSVSTGVTAGGCYLLAVAVGLLGQQGLRRGLLSWVPWAVSFALLPSYVTYGGYGGSAEATPAEPVMSVLFAALGIGVHFLRALFGLVADHQDGWTYLPLRLSLRIGATRMLVLTSLYLVLVGGLIAVAAVTVGLRA